MEIRLANLGDLNACLAIDDSFETEYVWQVEERSGAGDISIGLHRARLPRPMKVGGVISRDDLLYNFHQGDHGQPGGALFVADDGAVCGFVDVTESGWNQVAYINNLAVAPAYRRKGVGAQLMRAALDWGRERKLRAAMLDTSTKAHPAISFCQKHGFLFCGFNDMLYPNRDIALLFALSLR
jgi:ribosomal protein S18 acetylase RimI-like enzyme